MTATYMPARNLNGRAISRSAHIGTYALSGGTCASQAVGDGWATKKWFGIAAVVAATQLNLAGATLLILHATLVAVLAWSPEASRAQRPISARLPAPRPRRRSP